MKKSEIIEEIFKKYKYSRPVPDDIQNKVAGSRKKALKAILFKTGSYTPGRFLVVSLYFWLKKWGISISVKATGNLFRGLFVAAATMLIFVGVKAGLPYLWQTGPGYFRNHVAYMHGTITLTRNDEKQKIKKRDMVKEGDVIVTGKESALAIAFEQIGLTVLESKTKIKISMNNKNAGVSIKLRQGKILSLVARHSKKKYIITTPGCMALVNGTTFSVAYFAGKTTIALVDGRVTVHQFAGNKKYVLKPGNTAVIDQQYRRRNINRKEKVELKKLDLIQKALQDTTANDKHLQLDLTKVDQQLKSKRRLSLSSIRKQCGRLDIITTKQGKKVTGCIEARGAYYTMLTIYGRVKISQKQIDTVEVK